MQTPSWKPFPCQEWPTLTDGGLLFCWQASARVKNIRGDFRAVVLKVQQVDERREGNWRLCKKKQTAAMQERTRILPGKACVFVRLKCKRSTLIYEDVSTRSGMIPPHSADLLETPLLPGALLSHYWLEILHTVTIRSKKQSEQNSMKRKRKAKVQKHWSPSVHSHLISYCC